LLTITKIRQQLATANGNPQHQLATGNSNCNLKQQQHFNIVSWGTKKKKHFIQIQLEK